MAKKVKKAKSPKFFAVKSLYMTSVVGSKTTPHLVEERIVMVKAATVEQAISLGIEEAKDYASHEYTNIQKKNVKTTLLTSVDAFELYDKPGHMAEVYSSTSVYKKKPSETQILNEKLGKEETAETLKLRKNFMHP